MADERKYKITPARNWRGILVLPFLFYPSQSDTWATTISCQMYCFSLQMTPLLSCPQCPCTSGLHRVLSGHHGSTFTGFVFFFFVQVHRTRLTIRNTDITNAFFSRNPGCAPYGFSFPFFSTLKTSLWLSTDIRLSHDASNGLRMETFIFAPPDPRMVLHRGQVLNERAIPWLA